jgi:phosphate:Na+ symporter
LPLLPQIVEIFERFQPDPAQMTAEFHLAFNVALALIFIGLLDGLAWLLMRILPEQKKPADPAAPLYLDETAIDTPSVALACAARETLHMGDIVEAMLRDSITALMTDDRKLVAQLSRMDNVVDRLDEAIKFYVTKITRESLDDRDGRRAMEIISFAINLEHMGDIIDKNLMELAAKKIKHRYQFSKEGAAELMTFHQRTLDNLKLAFGVFMSGDIKVARKLLAEKASLREAELSAAENHLARLREGRPESIETSSLHLDILRDLKRIHSHICSVAYPVLEAAGELEPSRLKRTDDVLALPNALSATESPPPTQQAS